MPECAPSHLQLYFREALAIVPLLLLVAFLAPAGSADASTAQNLASIGWAIGMIALLILAGRGLPTAEVDDIIQAVTQADHVKLKEQRRKASPGASRADLINAIKPDPIAPQPKGSHP